MEPGRMGRIRILAFLVAALVAPIVNAGDWSSLERFQKSVTRVEFERLVNQVYCPSGALTNYLTFTTNAVTIYSTSAKTNALFTLQFAGKPQVPIRHPPLRIVLDPGHIGGEWARMEERFFVRGKDRPVQEAVLNLTVTRLLKTQLEAAGITVLLTKDNFQPVTDKRPEDFRAQAERDIFQLNSFDIFTPLEREAAIADAVRKRQELLFYRTAELAARARHVNDDLKPDLTICLHFNAVEWNEHFDLVDDNRLVIFIHGNYLAGEITDDDQKFRLFAKILEGSHAPELAAAEAIATALARATGLPPVEYGPSGGAVRIGDNPYVYARNLAANRLFDGPVIYLEPYYQNNRLVYQRIQLGDFDGTKIIEGKEYRSIYREYADAVAEGIANYIKQSK